MKIQQRFSRPFIFRRAKMNEVEKKSTDLSHFMGPLSSHKRYVWISKRRAMLIWFIVICYHFDYSYADNIAPNTQFEYLMGRWIYAWR